MEKKEEEVVPTKETAPVTAPAAVEEEEGSEQPLEPFEEGVDVEEVENEEDYEQQPTPSKVRAISVAIPRRNEKESEVLLFSFFFFLPFDSG